MKSFDAWHLPGLAPAPQRFETFDVGALTIRVPALDGEQLENILDELEQARALLRNRCVTDVIAAVDAATARLAEPATLAEATRLIAAATGYSAPTVTDVLAHMLRDWSRDSLATLVDRELGGPAALDAWAPAQAGARVHAQGPGLAFHVFSGNVPGVAVTSLIRCLLVKAPSLGKTASGEPVLPVLFARALAAVDDELAQCIAVTYWPGGTAEVEDRILARADTVIVYGGADAVGSITARARPDARVVVHGPKLSIGVVGPAADENVATDIARAVAAYDQQGCVSPHVVYVMGGDDAAKTLARGVAAALERLAASHPRRALDTTETLAIRDARARAEFRAIANADAEVFASADTSYTVIFEKDPTLHPSCLNRTLYIKPIAHTDALAAVLVPHRRILQSAGIAGFSANQAIILADVLAECGITRTASFQDLPWPRMWWHHDGRGPLRELLSWHELDLD